MAINESHVRVLYKDTDQMGIVYYANYLIWFEIGRSELFRAMGIPYSEFEKNEIYLPVIKVHCEYKKPAYYDDELKIITEVNSLQELRILFVYRVYRESLLLANGSSEHAFVNGKGNPQPLHKHSPFLWRRLKKIVEGGDN